MISVTMGSSSRLKSNVLQREIFVFAFERVANRAIEDFFRFATDRRHLTKARRNREAGIPSTWRIPSLGSP